MRFFTGPDHRLLLPASFMAGGIFLLVSDTVARTVFLPGEIPVGIVTSLIGAPVFIFLLAGRKGK
jgi:iron complex transport system permease protein